MLEMRKFYGQGSMIRDKVRVYVDLYEQIVIVVTKRNNLNEFFFHRSRSRRGCDASV